MTKQELIEALDKNHQKLIDYVSSLTEDKLTYSYNGKWTAGQQLNHAYLCILPFTRVLASKEFILHKFGKIQRATWDYATVVENYLKTSRKAPEQFLPGEVNPEQKTQITADFKKTIPIIQQLLNEFTDEELDSLAIPHPLLGDLTIREMFYLMTYHPLHHLKQTELNLGMLAIV